MFHYCCSVAGSNAMLRVYLIECLPAKRRGTCLASIDLLWAIGCISTLGKYTKYDRYHAS